MVNTKKKRVKKWRKSGKYEDKGALKAKKVKFKNVKVNRVEDG